MSSEPDTADGCSGEVGRTEGEKEREPEGSGLREGGASPLRRADVARGR